MACAAGRSGRSGSRRRGRVARRRLVLARLSADESRAPQAGSSGARVPAGDHRRCARAFAVGRPDPEFAGPRFRHRLRHERRHRHEQPRRRRRRPVHRHGRHALLRRVARRPFCAGRPGHPPRLRGEARTGRVRGLQPARGRRLRDRDRQPAGTPLERHRRNRQRLPAGCLGGERRRVAADDPDERRDQPRQLGRRARRPAGPRDRDSHARRDGSRARRGRGSRHRLRDPEQPRQGTSPPRSSASATSPTRTAPTSESRSGTRTARASSSRASPRAGRPPRPGSSPAT